MARIILVEDDELIRETTKELLEVIGHEVVLSAPRGDNALEAAPGLAAVDLAIIDLSLPDTDGDRLAARLRVIFPDLAVIISSGRRLIPADLDLAPEKLFILQKPYDIDALSLVITQAMA